LGVSSFKVTEPIKFDFSQLRERDWSNLASIHKNMNRPIIWSTENRVISDVPAMLEIKDSVCTAISVSTCGNFCFTGFENGQIEKFNIQSGLSRGVFSSSCKY
jgi:U3 small nucleolar RNA-associated protein 21